MEEAFEAIISRIEEIIAEDKNRGRRAAHDFVDWLTAEMEVLASERIELEQSMASTIDDPQKRGALVEEMASRLEQTTVRARFTKELIDTIIERLYGLGPDDRLEM